MFLAEAFMRFVDFQKVNPHLKGQYFQIDELEIILNDGKCHENLTVKFYGEKVIRFLRHELLKEEWKRYI